MPKVKSSAEQQAESLLQQALMRLVGIHGFFVGPLLRKIMRAVPPEQCPTIGTDGGVYLLYNAEWLAQWSVPQVQGLLVHEACHDLGLHPFRQQWREWLPWNVACDMTCNQIVGECGFALPPGGIPAKPNTTPEAEYEELMRHAKQCRSGHCQMQRPMGADGGALTGAALVAAEHEARLQAAAAAELAQRAGNMPAGLARLVGVALQEHVPWEQIVARFVTQSAHTESAWRRPNRRYLARGLVLPSLYAPEVPCFVLACDTSGSMADETLRRACGQILHAQATCERHGATTLWVAWCDTEVYPQLIESEHELAPKGGGGTAFSPVFAWVNEEVPETRGVVYVTDGHCSDFGPAPDYPVLWVLTAVNEGFQPPFGEIAWVL